MLRRVPGGAFEKLMHRRRAVEGFHRLRTGFIFEFAPPIFDTLDDSVTVGGNLLAGCAGSVSGPDVGVMGPVFDAIDSSLEESFPDAKDMVAQQPQRSR